MSRSEARSEKREVVVPLSGPVSQIEPVTYVRGTVLVSSLQSLASHMLLTRYYQALPSELHGEVRSLVAGAWVPAQIALAHYRACDALCLAPTQEVEIGRTAGARIDRTLFASLLKLAKQAGVTPWAALGMFGKIQARVLVGGAVTVHAFGPKDAVIELYKIPVFDLRYMRNAYCGAVQGLCDRFCRKSYMKVTEVTAGRAVFELSWA